MKATLILLVIVGLATAAQQVPEAFSDRSLSSAAVEAIEGIRDQMPCGFPGLGIPPLAPLKIPYKEVDIDTEALKLKGAVEDFNLNGLNDFDIEELKINAITSRVTFNFLFRDVNLDTKYDLSVFLKKAGFTINLVGNGPAKFAIKEMSISGIVRYSLGVISGKLRLRTLSIRTQIGEVESDIQGVLGEAGINEKFNEALAELVQVGVNENEDEIADTIESIALPRVNSLLSDMTIADLASLVTGGGSGEKTECIPPSY